MAWRRMTAGHAGDDVSSSETACVCPSQQLTTLVMAERCLFCQDTRKAVSTAPGMRLSPETEK